ncbi:hypothetical protein BGX31_011661 [Mortierella sp. GBA43]|nr:hypothetical protein BGX31_011661 [Mortierella sp. GBA43]
MPRHRWTLRERAIKRCQDKVMDIVNAYAETQTMPNMWELRGAVQDFTWRRINAIVELAPQFIIWPNAGQKEQICRWFRDKKPFPNAIGAIDGVELVLLRGPSYDTKA